jgi:outer membrane protein TolC
MAVSKIMIQYFRCSILCLFILYSSAVSAQQKDLNFFLNKALTGSPLLKDLNNQILMNRIDSMRLRAGYLPQVTASSSGLYAPVIKGYGYDDALSNGQSLDALLTVNYQLIKKGYLNNQIENFRLHADSIRFAAKISEQDLRKAVIEQYISAYASQQQVEFNLEVSDLLSNEEIILQKLTRANVYKQTDYLTFLVTFQQQKLQLRQAQIQFKNDYATLNYLSGIADTTTVRLPEPGISLTTRPELKSSIYLKQFSIDSLRMANQRTLIDFSYRPKASVFANAGYMSSFIMQPYKNFGTSYGFTIAVPIYDGHQKKMQYNRLTLEESSRSSYRDFFVNQLRQQQAILNQQIREKQSLNSQIDEQIKFAKSLIEVDSKLIQTGDVTIADFVIAINNYLNALNISRQTNIELLKLINQANYWNN